MLRIIAGLWLALIVNAKAGHRRRGRETEKEVASKGAPGRR